MNQNERKSPSTPNNSPAKRENSKKIAKPPDGGWGWWVVAASFLIHVVADGVAYTFGLFFVEINNDLHETKSRTSWIASIMAGVTYSIGPVSSAFVNKFGCRVVSVAGSIIAAAGFALSYYSQSVTYLYISIGVFGGIGLGLIYLPAIVSVTCYFEKRRAFATGIAVCGSGFGTFILAPVMEWLIQVQGWRAAFISVGAILLTCLLFSLFFRPIKEEDDEFCDEYENDEEIAAVFDNKNRFNVDLSKPLVSSPCCDTPEPVIVKGANGISMNKALLSKEIHEKMLPKGVRNTLTMSSSHPILVSETTSDFDLHKGARARRSKRHSLRIGANGSIDNRPVCYTNPGLGAASSDHHPGLIVQRKDIFYSGSLLRLTDIQKFHDLQAQLDRRKNTDEASTTGSIKSIKICGIAVTEYCQVIKTMLDFSILKNPVFLFFAISNFLTSIGYNVPYIYLVDMAIENAKERNMTVDTGSLGLLISIIGISNTLSRVVLGYLSDKKWVNRLYLYNSALTLCGIATAISSHTADITLLRIYAAAFGATVGVYVSLTSVILVDLLGLEKLTNAFGFLLLFQGTATLIGPPLVGKLFDVFNSYKYGFYLAGGMIAFSGLMLFLIPCVKKPRKDENEEANTGDAESSPVEQVGTKESIDTLNNLKNCKIVSNVEVEVKHENEKDAINRNNANESNRG